MFSLSYSHRVYFVRDGTEIVELIFSEKIMMDNILLLCLSQILFSSKSYMPNIRSNYQSENMSFSQMAHTPTIGLLYNLNIFQDYIMH